MESTQSWQSLFRAPQPCDHIIQLYTDDTFLGRAAGQFIGIGLEHSEGAVLIATPAHAELITAALASRVDVAAARQRGQLVVLDARSCLDQFMVDGRPDPEKFFAVVDSVLDRVVQAGYGKMRLFGEMVDLLWSHNFPATLELEDLWNRVLAARRVALLCAYRIDNFDRHAHRGVLHQLSRGPSTTPTAKCSAPTARPVSCASSSGARMTPPRPCRPRRPRCTTAPAPDSVSTRRGANQGKFFPVGARATRML